MEIAGMCKTAAALVTSIGVIGGGALYIEDAHDALDDRHAPREALTVIESQLHVSRIFDLVQQAHDEGSPNWLCRAIESEYIELCTEVPAHFLCKDADAHRELVKKAGCE